MGRTTVIAAMALVVLGLALAGCDDDGPAGAGTTAPVVMSAPDAAAGAMLAYGGLSVAEARATGGETIVVRAFVFVDADGTARLCDLARESYPPQCGGAAMPVTGLPPELVAGLPERDGARWSDGPVQLAGAMRDGAFVNDPVALAAG
jgi:hypothetical protein